MLVYYLISTLVSVSIIRILPLRTSLDVLTPDTVVDIETTVETMLYTNLHYNEFHSEPKHKNNDEFD